MYYRLVTLSVAVCVAVDQPGNADIVDAFQEYMKTFDKHYDNLDMGRRLAAFAASYLRIKAENAKNLSFKLGLNEFSDMTQEHFLSTRYSQRRSNESFMNALPLLGTHELSLGDSVPAAVDWRKHGAVTPVKNQGDCGSCWSFSATGALEGAWKISSGSLVELSQQQFLDCDFGGDAGLLSGDGDRGCYGGEPYWAFDYAQGAALCTERSYPYTATGPETWKEGQKSCSAHASCQVGLAKGTVLGYRLVTRFSTGSLLDAVASQPVSVQIDADADIFRHYRHGVIQASCGFLLDHAVLVVGYGTENSLDYWTVKNSWGVTWGESGYVRLTRDGWFTGECGIRIAPHYPVVRKPEDGTLVV